ncbi:hypothetical protein J6590_012662 [Homalodisca vitripennis]|nr:hypothetical protein J6590_012660 [Homalodisca vitripennis]KAG8332893.1 hypothetical protein J6590_012662 [Homalodisca vitripennis]
MWSTRGVAVLCLCVAVYLVSVGECRYHHHGQQESHLHSNTHSRQVRNHGVNHPTSNHSLPTITNVVVIDVPIRECPTGQRRDWRGRPYIND